MTSSLNIFQDQAISRLRDHKTEPNVRGLLQQICDLVQREELNVCLNSLDLLENGPIPTGVSAATATTAVPPPSAPLEEAAAFVLTPDPLG